MDDGRVTTRPRPIRVAGVALFGLALAAGGCQDLGWRFGIAEPDIAAEASRPDKNENREMIAGAQRLLAALGYDVGMADGVLGPKTRNAIRGFQENAELPPDGKVDAELLRRLKHSIVDLERGGGVLDLGAVASPLYEKGSRYVYSDGRTDTVVDIEEGRVHWQTNRGTRFTTHRNFILPALSWESAESSGNRRLDADPDVLWPLRLGKTATFTSQTLKQYGGRPDNRAGEIDTWHCRVASTERISVVAGTFDTVKIVCERPAQGRTPRLTRIWYYAPTVRHFVRQNDIHDAMESDRHIELVAVQPVGKGWPPIARAGLNWAFDHSLETAADGEGTLWNSSAVRARVVITPHARYQRGDGKLCRTFTQTWMRPGERRVYPGTACRDDSGHWQIPGLAEVPNSASS